MEQSKRQPAIRIVRRSHKIFVQQSGGTWKIAYADLLTTMMIFFLCMWLLSLVSREERAIFSEYFKQATLFEEMKSRIPRIQLPNKAIQRQREVVRKKLAAKLGSLPNYLIIDSMENGIRIEVTDTKNGILFQSGSSRISEKGTEIIRAIADCIRDGSGKITIEGHTDCIPCSGGISNWELSIMRALVAKSELERSNIPLSRIDKITGYADTRPLMPKEPENPRNRRISIFVTSEKFEQFRLD